MTTSVSTPDEYIASFPEIPSKIVGRPTYDLLTELRNTLKINTASVECLRGGGHHGYLGCVVSQAIYNTIAPGQPFTIPAHPGVNPVLPANPTGAQIAHANRQHTQELYAWREYTNVNNALKKQLTNAVESIYLRPQRDAHVGFANRTVRELLAYLFTAYGSLSPQRLVTNQQEMYKAWDPNEPFETVIDQIETGMEMADTAGQAFTAAQILTNAYTLVFNTGLYFDDCKTWNAKPAADKTWNNFKTHFLTAQAELRAQQDATTGRQGFSAHVEDKTANALEKLAEAQATDRQAFCQLVTTNSELSEQLKLALQEIQTLKQLVLTNTNNNNNTNTNYNRQYPANNNYCWTHGYKVAGNHTSATCRSPKTGHKKDATRANPQDGSTAGKNS